MLLIIFSRSGEVSSIPNYIRATTSNARRHQTRNEIFKETFPLWLAFHKNWKVMTILSITTSLPPIIIPLPPPTNSVPHLFLDARGIHGVLSLEMFPSDVLLKEWNGETPEGVGNLTFLAKAKPIQKGWRCEDSPMPMKVRAVLETKTTFLVKWKVERNLSWYPCLGG